LNDRANKSDDDPPPYAAPMSAPRTPAPRTPAPKPAPPRATIEAIVSSAPAAVFLLSLEGRYLYASRRLISGSPEKEGKLLEEVHQPEHAAEFRALMKRVESTKMPHSGELSVVDAIGRPRRYLVKLAPFLALGRLDGYVGVGMHAMEIEPMDASAAVLAARLTPKQRKVLVLVAEGLSSREIGRRLGVGERTVETHREQLMDRLGIRGVAALARFAMSAGLL
jgi:DNA-binding CsgD family transcriptional regulator